MSQLRVLVLTLQITFLCARHQFKRVLKGILFLLLPSFLAMINALHIQFYMNDRKAKIKQSNGKETKKILNPYT
jgi:hypothetical protein